MRNRLHRLALPGTLLACLWLAACSADKPCVVCFEDEWSREPFPGQPKQRLAPLSPDSAAPQGIRPSTLEFLGTATADESHPF